MNSPRLGACIAAAALLSACDLSVPMEPQVPIDLAIDFCSNDMPVWFAYQTSEGPTTRLQPDANGTYRFTATNRVIIGMVWQRGADTHTEIISAANYQLEAISGVECLEEAGTKTVNGNVTGFGAGQIAVVGMGVSSAPLDAGNTTYSLTNLAERPLDLIASRQVLGTNSRAADRIVLKRTQNITNNGTAPLIDFASGTDLVQATSANVGVSGILANELAYLQNNFFSQLETSHSLSYAEGIANGTFSFPGVPAASLATGDYHDLMLTAVNATTGSVRGAENFFRAPGGQTLALGPGLMQPLIGPIPNAEYVRLRMVLPGQQSYDDLVSVEYRQQQQLSTTTMRLTMTLGFIRQFIGSWTLDIPDLTGANGWQDSWGLDAGMPIEWTVTAMGGRAELLFGAKPNDAEFIRYASLQSTVTPALRATPVAARSLIRGR